MKTEVAFENREGRTLSRRKEFYDNGNLMCEGLYAKGAEWNWDIPIGLVKRYYEDGKVLSEEMHDESGMLNGDATYYSKLGVLEKKVHFKNGKNISEVHYDKEGKEIVPVAAAPTTKVPQN